MHHLASGRVASVGDMKSKLKEDPSRIMRYVRMMSGYGDAKKIPEEEKKTIPFGYPLHGSPADMMDELGEAWRLEWRVSNGKMEVSDENGLVSKNKNEAPVISAASGLIDIPFYTSGESTKTKKDTTRRVGLQFKALLNPDLVPGKLVRVESFSTAVVSKNANGEVKPIQGWYRIHSAKYTGDFRGNDWYVECFCTIVLEDDFK
jgi:hypothetical protein